MMLPPEIRSLDPWQREALTSNASENHVLVHRQGGKSEIIAVKAITVALTEDESLILCVSRSWRQSLELARKIRKALTRYQQALLRQHQELDYVDLGLLTDAKSEFELPNGSRIVSLPPNEETIRGYSKPRLVVLDEASRIPDDVYLCLRPMKLASPNWELWLISTPFGQRGFFYQESRNPSIKKFKHTVDDALRLGRVTQQFIDEERKKGDIYFRQEFQCEFVSNLQTLFNRKELEDLLVDGEPLGELYALLGRT
jgi:Terminase large subunit, T4likevirus-type, N-terminal